MNFNFKIKNWYITFISKKDKNILEKILHFCFLLLSTLYTLLIYLRNFLYDKRILKVYKVNKKVLSIGNLSWGGVGKTSLVLYLYKELSPFYKIAVIRRGYGEDEDKLLKEEIKDTYSSVNRYKLIKQLEKKYDLFILDDGFQYRKIKKDIEIVIMRTDELEKKIFFLIPFSSFRESVNSLKRADFLLINYTKKITYHKKNINFLRNKFPFLKIYCMNYKFKKMVNLKEEKVDFGYFKDKNLALFTAIGYPEGFINFIEELGFCFKKKIIYPDHYILKETEFLFLQKELLKENIFDVIITRKDRYHLPIFSSEINFFIVDAEITIEEKDSFLDQIKEKLR